jgi:predicted NBD/HSP70 family sugar kinase
VRCTDSHSCPPPTWPQLRATEHLQRSDRSQGHGVLQLSCPGSTQTPVLGGCTDKVNIAEVIQAAQNNDEASQAALKRAGEWIGRALGTVINLMNPSMILLDGDVIRKTDILFESLQHSAQESSLHATWSGVKIMTCKLEKPVAVGAVANVVDFISGSYQ